MERRKGGGCDGKGRGELAAKQPLLLKTHGCKSPSRLSKCLPHSLTKVDGREMHVWGNALVHGRSEQKTMVWLQGDQRPGPTSATELPHRQQDVNWAFASFFSVLPLFIFMCMYFDWTYLKFVQ